MNDPQDEAKDLKDMTFEEAMSALEQIVARLESGNASLEQSINLYTRGTQLKSHCEAKLKDAQAKIEKITLDDAGAASSTVPLDVE